MKELHIERTYLYGDNEHYYVSVPDDFVAYEYDYFSTEKQKHYIYFGKYNKKLYKSFEVMLGVEVYKIEGNMLVLLFNKPTGMYIHNRDVVSKDLNELKEKFEPVIKEFYFNAYVPRKSYSKESSDLINRFFTPDIPNDERLDIVDKLLKSNELGDLVAASIKVLEFDGYDAKVAIVNVHDILGREVNSSEVRSISLDKLFEDVIFKDDYMLDQTYARMTKDPKLFNKHYENYKKLIESV